LGAGFVSALVQLGNLLNRIRDVFLVPILIMFEFCSIINKLCAFCTHSDYNQNTGEHDGTVREFCGMITGGDTTTRKLGGCWLKMSNYEKTKFKKDSQIISWK